MGRRRRKRAAIRARSRYRPSLYDGPIVLIRSTERAAETLFDCDPLLGWRPFATGDILVREASGPHIELLDEPQVQTVAAAVADAIAAAQR